MNTSKNAAQIVLKIRGEKPFKVATLADASAIYQRYRDESGEGASTFPDGKLAVGARSLKISYNGRIWDGETLVQEAT